MKRVVYILMTLVAAAMVFGALSCGQSAATPTPSITVAPTVTPTKAPLPTPTSAPTATPHGTPGPTQSAAPATPVPTVATPKPTVGPTPTPVPTSTAPVIAKQTWKLTHGYAADSLRGRSAQMFADMVTEQSGGQITVQVFPNSTLFTSSRDPDAVGTGAAQVSFTPGMIMVPLGLFFNALNMDGLFVNYDMVWKVIHTDVWAKTVSDAIGKMGIHYVGTTPDQMGAWYVTDKLIKAQTDMKGMKYAVPTGSQQSVSADFLGQKPVSMLSTESLTAFQQGIIDCYATGATQFDALHVWEWAKYMFVFPARAPATTIIMINQKTWDSLPASFQQVLTNTIVPALADFTNTQAQLLDKSLIDKWTKNGMTINKQTTAEVDALWAAVKDTASNQKIIATIPADLWSTIMNLRTAALQGS